MEPAVKLPPGLAELCAELYPEGRICHVQVLGADASSAATGKGVGYGVPLRLRARLPDGARASCSTPQSDEFGHDRRADRAAEMLLAFDRFDGIPGHVSALDVGAIKKGGRELISLAEAGELYLVTSFAEGHLYADELRRMAQTSVATETDLAHAEALARHLVEIHAGEVPKPAPVQARDSRSRRQRRGHLRSRGRLRSRCGSGTARAHPALGAESGGVALAAPNEAPPLGAHPR